MQSGGRCTDPVRRKVEPSPRFSARPEGWRASHTDGRRQSSLCSARTRRRLLHERHEPCRRRFRPPAVVGRGWTLPSGLVGFDSHEKGVTEGTTGFLFIPALTAHAREGPKKGRAGLPSSRRPAPLARPGRARCGREGARATCTKPQPETARLKRCGHDNPDLGPSPACDEGQRLAPRS